MRQMCQIMDDLFEERFADRLKEEAEDRAKEQRIEMAKDAIALGVLTLAQIAKVCRLPFATVEELAKAQAT